MVGFYDIWERENRGGRSGGEQSEKETFAWELINLIWLITCSFHTSEVGAKAEAFLGSLKFPTLPFYTYNLFMITWYDFQLRTHQSILPTILYLTSFRPTPSLLTSINLNPIGHLTMYPSYVLISSLSLISLSNPTFPPVEFASPGQNLWCVWFEKCKIIFNHRIVTMYDYDMKYQICYVISLWFVWLKWKVLVFDW